MPDLYPVIRQSVLRRATAVPQCPQPRDAYQVSSVIVDGFSLRRKAFKAHAVRGDTGLGG